MPLAENKFGHGAKRISKLRRSLHKLGRHKLGKAPIPFDWDEGVDIRDKVGSLPIKNQGSSSSCSGQAGSLFIEIQERLRKVSGGEISAKSIYSPIFHIGGGTTVTELITQLGAKGSNLEKDVPSYDAYGNPLSEAMFIEHSWMTSQTLKDAFKRAGYTPIDLPENMEDIACAIRDWGCVICEIAGQNGNTPSWLSETPQPPVKSNPEEIWYHFILFTGAKNVNGVKTLFFQNSWGKDVGNLGVQQITQNYFDAGGIIDAFTLGYYEYLKPVSDKGLTLSQKIWFYINLWFRSLKLNA